MKLVFKAWILTDDILIVYYKKKKLTWIFGLTFVQLAWNKFFLFILYIVCIIMICQFASACLNILFVCIFCVYDFFYDFVMILKYCVCFIIFFIWLVFFLFNLVSISVHFSSFLFSSQNGVQRLRNNYNIKNKTHKKISKNETTDRKSVV